MRTLTNMVLGIALPLCAMAAVPAQAAIVKFTFSGTISQQINDPSNVAPVGTAFSGWISYDDAASRSRARGDFVNEVTGSFDNSSQSPFLSSSFQLGALSVGSGGYAPQPIGAYVTDYLKASQPDSLLFSAGGFLLTLYDPSNRLTYTHLPTAAELATMPLTARFESRYASFSAGTASIAVQGVSAVPEPAAWILMIAGFAATGAALRSRRRRTAGSVQAL